jgi:hypothetical protein
MESGGARPYRSKRNRPCDLCRYRKVCCRIDMEPPCSNCIQNKTECTFLQPATKRPRTEPLPIVLSPLRVEHFDHFHNQTFTDPSVIQQTTSADLHLVPESCLDKQGNKPSSVQQGLEPDDFEWAVETPCFDFTSFEPDGRTSEAYAASGDTTLSQANRLGKDEALTLESEHAATNPCGLPKITLLSDIDRIGTIFPVLGPDGRSVGTVLRTVRRVRSIPTSTLQMG